jgi:hypothetical protein
MGLVKLSPNLEVLSWHYRESSVGECEKNLEKVREEEIIRLASTLNSYINDEKILCSQYHEYTGPGTEE